MENLWLESNELVLVFKNGTFHVLERFEDYNSVFHGNYKSCIEYMKNREIEYLESQF